MPRIDHYTDDVISTSLYEDQDEVYLRSRAVCPPVRTGNHKPSSDRVRKFRSLDDILQELALGHDRYQTLKEEDESKSRDVVLEQRDYELLVKGFYIDDRILPGFRYTVRYIGKDEYLFNGEAKRLESIGLGYGRRLTFQGESLNHNENFFWTDSSQTGFAFCIEAIREGDVFSIVDSNHCQPGQVTIMSVEFPQMELDSSMEGKTVVKRVQVRFSCSVLVHRQQKSLVNVKPPGYAMMEGVAELVKPRGCREARVRCINDVYLPSLGKCILHADL